MGSKALHKVWNPLRDAAETAASIAGNYYLPGSSLITNRIVSKGAQDNLNSPLGKIAQIGSGLAGGGAFEGADGSGIPGASNYGGGWTNAGNKIGGLFGNGEFGTNIADNVSGISDSIGSKFGSALSNAGHSLGLTGEGGLFSGSGSGLSDTASNGGGLSGLFKSGSSALDTGTTSTGFSSLANAGTNLAAGGGGSSYGGLAAALGGLNSLSANDDAQKHLLDAQNRSISQFQPYLDSGQASNTRLSELLGTGGNSGAEGYGSLTKPFNPGDLTQDPGYQFQLQQGTDAINRSLGAKGKVFSGEALKASQEFGQGLADQSYKDAYARDAQQKAQQYGMFSGQSGQGQNAAGSASNLYSDIGNAQANADISSANILNQSLSSLLTGSGARRLIGYGQNGQPIYV